MELELTKISEINLPKILNTVLDIGLKSVLPDFIEEDIIEIKDTFINNGFAEGVQEILDKVEDISKSITGIFTGNFETVEQVKRLIQTDGILDGISSLIDVINKKLLDSGTISKETYNLIKSGKKEILNILEDDLKSSYKETTYSLEKLDQYCEEWKEYYENEDYDGMESITKKIESKLESSELVVEVINKAETIQEIQEYIEKKGSIDNLTKSEKKLLEKLN